MDRKQFITTSSLALSSFFLGQEGENLSEDHLAGTELLSVSEVKRLRSRMLTGMRQYFEQALESSPKNRKTHWNRDYSSLASYQDSIVPNRTQLKKITGVVDERKPVNQLTLMKTTARKALVAETDAYTIYSVCWSALDGVHGVGLWLEPRAEVRAQIVALPEASWTPEMLVGLSSGVPLEAQFARRLASAGCRVVIPVLINRKNTWSGNPEVRMTNQSHREFIYRRAYELGRHIIGYEVQKVLALVDWFTKKNKGTSTYLPIAVAGYGEGGLIAFYSAAIDNRIDGTLVSGYFQEREGIWKEPLYRNVWGLITEFGDADIASLIAPNYLVIEACKGPETENPPFTPLESGYKHTAAPGRLETPPLESVRKEARRAKKVFEKLKIPGKFQLTVNDKGRGLPGSEAALQQLLNGIGVETEIPPSSEKQLKDSRVNFEPEDRMYEQFSELLDHTDKLIKESDEERQRFWNKADFSSVQQWEKSTEVYRSYFWEEIIGKMPSPSQPFNPRSRLTYETANWRGYWIKLDVWSQIIAGGILLVPKDIQPGEQRPVVVCQHGASGQPEPLVDPKIKSSYHSYGAQLADLGYVVYAPQNPYGRIKGLKKFRIIQRMANPLKKSIFSVIIGQHEQTLEWLKQLSFVDGERVGFYGLSYGGKTAMRVPPVLQDYALVICSGDFNEYVWKMTSLNFRGSFMFTDEYEMYEFNLANKLNYAEMAGLIAPRPFMVERGHGDGVALDEWVAYEYAKVRKLYDQMDIGDQTAIEYFQGPHEINGVGTFKFLDKHLKLYKKENN